MAILSFRSSKHLLNVYHEPRIVLRGWGGGGGVCLSVYAGETAVNQSP